MKLLIQLHLGHNHPGGSSQDKRLDQLQTKNVDAEASFAKILANNLIRQSVYPFVNPQNNSVQCLYSCHFSYFGKGYTAKVWDS